MFTLCSLSWEPNQKPAAPDPRSSMDGRLLRRGFGAGEVSAGSSGAPEAPASSGAPAEEAAALEPPSSSSSSTM